MRLVLTAGWSPLFRLCFSGANLLLFSRKKTRCPAEKPACSSCVRLNQPCYYTPTVRAGRGGQSVNLTPRIYP